MRKMMEEDGVSVTYVRGNHDHEITEDMVKALFGDKVRTKENTSLLYQVISRASEQEWRYNSENIYKLHLYF